MDLFILIAQKFFTLISFKSLSIPIGIMISMISTYMHDMLEPLKTRRKPASARETRIKILASGLISFICLILLENIQFETGLLKFGLYCAFGAILGFSLDAIFSWTFNKENHAIILRCVWIFIKIVITTWASATKSAFIEALNEAKEEWEMGVTKSKKSK